MGVAKDGRETGGTDAGGDEAVSPRRYRRLSQLGAGAMGVVWETYDRERGIRVALKELKHVSPQHLLLFKREFRALRDIRHRNLVALYDLLEEDGRWCFTMELVEGIDFLAYTRTEDADDTATCTHFAPPTRTGSTALRLPTLATLTGDEGRISSEQPAVITKPLAAHFDEARSRASLRELAGGLSALHRSGTIHRDVKASNILVERGGRVVILDFGVAARTDEETSGAIVGTHAYMAPEQAIGADITPAVDWYALGVLLYRTLTGIFPFTGTPAELLEGKLLRAPPAPALLVPDAPADLSALALALLHPEAEKRPVADAILGALDLLGSRRSQLDEDETGSAALFVGRRLELRALNRTYAAAEEMPAIVLQGPSGVGKTATVEHFLSGLRHRRPAPWVLRGRCHERETVPFKALDGVVDDLAQALARAPDAPPPLDARTQHCLLRLFPSLGTTLEDSPRAAPWAIDHAEVRSLAFEGLRSVLRAASRERTLVVVIDDVQWADPDSRALLRALTASTIAGVALVIMARPGDETRAALDCIASPLEELEIGGLPHEDAAALLRALLEQRGEVTSSEVRSRVDAEQLLDESGGHPMFLDELVRRAAAAPTFGGSLDDALRARALDLPKRGRQIVQLVAVAGAPVSHAAIARALDLDAATYQGELNRLRGKRLIRARGARRVDTVEPYHDRVREALYDALGEQERRAMHLSLANAIEASGDGAPELLTRHFELGGEEARAHEYAIGAAEAAESLLAFDRAAEHYGAALRLGDIDRAKAVELLRAQGEMLKLAGRAREAATAYAGAAQRTEGTERLELERCAAEQLLMGGHVAEGKNAVRRVLPAIQMTLPTAVGVLPRLGWTLARIALSRNRWRPRPASDCAPHDLYPIDLCWSVAAGLSMIDTTIGMFFSVVGMRASLQLGEPFRVARAACAVCTVASALDLARFADRMQVVSRTAALRHGSPLAGVYSQIANLVRSFLVDQRFERAEGLARETLQAWREAGMGAGFERDFVCMFLTWSLAMRGELTQEEAEVERLLAEARESGNRFLEVGQRVFHPTRFFVRDDPAEARRDVTDAIESWLDAPDFQLPHCWALVSLRNAAIYEGRLEETPLEARLAKRAGRSPMWLIRYVRERVRDAEARRHLALALETQQRGEGSRARHHRRRAAAHARRLARSPKPVTRLWGELARVGLSALRGDDEACVKRLEELIPRLERHDCHLHAACAQRRLGDLLGGDEGGAYLRASSNYFEAHGVRSPERMCALILPFPE